MSKEYFTDKLSVEDIAEMTDKMLRFENSRKSTVNIKGNLFKTIPAVAAIVLVIGAINIYPLIYNNIGENESGINPGTAIASSEDINDTDIIETETETVTTQIGTMIVITPKGQDPIQNDNGTVTLPGGGTFTIVDKDSELYNAKITVQNGYLINCEELESLYKFTNPLYNAKPIKSGETIIVEMPNGTIWTLHDRSFVPELKPDHFEEGEYGIELYEKPNGEVLVTQGLRWALYDENGNNIFKDPENADKLDHFKSFDYKYDAIHSTTVQKWTYFVDYSYSLEEQTRSFFGVEHFDDIDMSLLVNGPWIFQSQNNDSKEYKLDDGTKVTMSPAIATVDNAWDGNYGYIIFNGECAIEYANGVTVDAPVNTKVEYKDGKYIFTIGDGKATIIRLSGIPETLQAGAVLDGYGNIRSDYVIRESDIQQTSKIGELSITTQMGKEPIDNGDGTATLPGGGTITLSDGTIIIVPYGTVINIGNLKINPTHHIVNDIVESFSEGNITIINPNGSSIVFDNDEVISIDGMSMDEYVDEIIKDIRIDGLTLDEYIDNEVSKAYNDELNVNGWIAKLTNWLAENFNWNDRQTQVGELIIQTPDGQDPIKNSDGTTTLPSGGTVIRSDGTKLIFTSGAVLKADGDGEIIERYGDDGILRVELPNGNVIIKTDSETTINGENVDDVVNNMMNDYYESIP